MAFTLIGGTAIGTVLVCLPALYALWFRVLPADAAAGLVRLPAVSAGGTANAD